MSLSLVKSNEFVSPGAVKVGQYAEVQVDSTLTERRIYLFVDTVTSGDFVLFGSVIALDSSKNVIAEFDASLCSFADGQISTTKSIGTMFAAGGSAVGDSYVLQLGAPFNINLPSVVLQPLRVNLNIAYLKFEITGVAGLISGFRVWLGCLSTLI